MQDENALPLPLQEMANMSETATFLSWQIWQGPPKLLIITVFQISGLSKIFQNIL
jgi:hypothetical protein